MTKLKTRKLFSMTTLCQRAAFCAALVLAGCASQTVVAPETLIRQRAAERWNALIAGDFASAYGFSAPSFKSIVSQDAFRGRIGSAVIWLGTEITQVDCAEVVQCKVKLRLDFKPVLGGGASQKMSTYIDETWLLEDGQWWIFQTIKPS